MLVHALELHHAVWVLWSLASGQFPHAVYACTCCLSGLMWHLKGMAHLVSCLVIANNLFVPSLHFEG